MSRSLRRRLLTLGVLGTLGTVLAAGTATTANGEPRAVIQGRTEITAKVTGEKPGYRCLIAGKDISGPWGTVAPDGTVTLTLGGVKDPGKHLRVLCEDPKRGDPSLHTVRSDRVAYDGMLAPIRQIMNNRLFGSH